MRQHSFTICRDRRWRQTIARHEKRTSNYIILSFHVLRNAPLRFYRVPPGNELNERWVRCRGATAANAKAFPIHVNVSNNQQGLCFKMLKLFRHDQYGYVVANLQRIYIYELGQTSCAQQGTGWQAQKHEEPTPLVSIY